MPVAKRSVSCSYGEVNHEWRKMKRFINNNKVVDVTLLLIILSSLYGIAGCTGKNDPSRFTLKIVHVNDVHSNLTPSNIHLRLGGVETECEIGGMARVASKIKELKKNGHHHLVLHAGDAVQGTLYYTLFKGEADADVMNAMGFDAMTIGNHEFDDGDRWLAGFIARLDAPVISANIDVTPGNVLEGRYAPYVIVKIEGEAIGIVGLTIAGKTKNSSQPSDEVTFRDEVGAIQAVVEDLTSRGIGKIILLSHYGYPNVQSLVARVTGIDVIVDGDSHTLLGDFSAYGLESSGDYPTVRQNRDGDDVCIVQAWEHGKILGDLDVTFLDDVIESCSGTPHLILGERFTRENENRDEYTLEGAELLAVQAAVDGDAKLDIVADDADVADIVSTYSSKVDKMADTVIGTASEPLRHNRVPNHEYNGVTLPLGSQIAPIVAKAFYDQDPHSDICIQNAGGVRISIDRGNITYDTAYTLLPFSNTLFEIEMYGSEIKQVLEDAIENIDQGGSTGSFPYAYPLKYDVDATRAFGGRVGNLEIKSRITGSYSALQDNEMYVVVTNNYTAAGRDGYVTFADVQAKRGKGTDTYLDYAMSFANYVKDLTLNGEALKPLPKRDHCIKSYISTRDGNDPL